MCIARVETINYNYLTTEQDDAKQKDQYHNKSIQYKNSQN